MEVCEGIMLTLTADSDWLVQLRAKGREEEWWGWGGESLLVRLMEC